MSGPDKMRVCMCTASGGYDVMQVQEDHAKPKSPDAGQILLKVVVSGINFADLHARQGTYKNRQGLVKAPVILGMEASGIVEEVGKGVEHLKAGDRAFCIHMFGVWCEYILVDAEACFPVPEKMTLEEAACIPVNYITAYMMLFEQANLRKGKSVLVHMAAGGVGFAATQLIKSVEDTTVFGTSSAHKHDAIRSNGVDHPIDYRNKDYVEEVRKISPDGVDIILDPLSGPDTQKGYNLLKPLGQLIVFGAANAMVGERRNLSALFQMWWNLFSFKPLFAMTDNKTVSGFHLGFLDQGESKKIVMSVALDVLRMYKEGHVKPQVDSVWLFEKAGDAMKHIGDRKNVGKVLLTWDKERVAIPGDADKE